MTDLVDLPAAAATADVTGTDIEPDRRRIVAYVLRRPVAMAAAAFVALLVVVAVFAPLIAPYDSEQVDLLATYQRPSAEHWLGTDEIGRDVLSRIMFGARTSLVAALEAVTISTVIGVILGLMAGYMGRWIDTILSRANDALMSVPPLIFALAVVAVLGPGLTNAMLAVGIIFVPRMFRVTRAAAIDVRHTTFIEASLAVGCTNRRVLVAHVLPNVLSPILVVMSVSLATAVIAESALSYLGLGVQPPTPSWGGMLAEASRRLDLKYLMLSPGIVLALTVAAFTILGDTLRDAIGSRRGADRA